MKKLIDRGLLVIGCLFLAWILVLLIYDVTKTYEKTFTYEEYETVQKYEVLQEEENDSVLARGGKELLYIADSFIYAYNECGYYEYRLPYFGQKSDGSSKEVYLLIAFLLCIPVVAGGYIGHAYVLSGGVLVLILLVGQVPEYKYVVMLAAGWIYMHLIKSWIDRKKEGLGFREAFREVFLTLIPGYVIVIIMFLLLSYLLPSDRLPEANRDTKNMIFRQLQKLQLVSDQYEENQRKQTDNGTEKEDAEKESTQEESVQDIFLESEKDVDNGAVNNLQETDFPDIDTNESDGIDVSVETPEDFTGGEVPGNQIQDGTGYGIGFSLTSGGGISRGRTDRTGNLSFSGKTVLKVTADSKPENNLYVRLFYAENYEDNRWKETNEEQYVDIDAGEMVREITMPVFYSLRDGGGSKNIENDIFHLTYYEKNASELSFSSSRSVEMRFPEQEQYIDSVCQEVPADLSRLFDEQFGESFEHGTEELPQGEIAGKVERILEDTAYYTLSPGDAPEQEDFITWFLTKNKKGYCMHFASAGVMMLRAAGVSSRYAEGYFVPVSTWKKQEDGGWCAQVQDSNAHAWAEIYESGCWIPVELTPSYNGELAGSFAGQRDIYVGKTAIPAVVILGIRGILVFLCTVLLIMAGCLVHRKLTAFYEYRMLHTGDRRRDIKNMMKLLQRKMIRKNKDVRKLVKADYLTKDEFIQQILIVIPELEQDEKAEEYLSQFSNYVYKAAFGADISEKERKEAQFLYGKLIKKLAVNKNFYRRIQKK